MIKLSAIMFGIISFGGGNATAEPLIPTPEVEISENVTIIEIGQAVIVPVRDELAAIVVGNEEIVAANLINDKILVLTGLAVGDTNLILIDNEDAIFYERAIKITNPGTSIIVRRAGIESSVQCNLACRPVNIDATSAPSPPE